MRAIYQRDTGAVRPQERAAAWRDWIHESVVEMDLVPIAPEGFSSSIELCELARIAPHKVVGSPQRVTRTRTEIARGDKDVYYLISQPSKPWTIRHGRADHLVQPGQSVLVDSRLPYEFIFGQGLDDLSVELPPDWIERWLPDPGRWLGVPLDVHTPWGRTLRALKEALVPQNLARLSVPDTLIEDQLGVLLSLATEAIQPGTLIRSSVFKHCTDALRARLAEPGLVACDIARDSRTSLRSLHRAFAAEGCTFAGTLMQLRVEEAARMLSQRRFDRLSIAEIARRCGFSDGSHFSRVFKQVRGVSPKTFRAASAI